MDVPLLRSEQVCLILCSVCSVDLSRAGTSGMQEVSRSPLRRSSAVSDGIPVLKYFWHGCGRGNAEVRREQGRGRR